MTPYNEPDPSTTIATRISVNDFDALALYTAMDAQRTERGLSWRQVADEVWAQSATLNALRLDHPISPTTITGLSKRGDCTCQHALFFLRWLGRTPESFLSTPPEAEHGIDLPNAGYDRRLRWDLTALADALDARRRERELSWKALAEKLRCSDHQLTGIQKARYAIGMRLAMRIVQWLEQPAATFIYAAEW